jgi:hypothetical protein
LVEKSRGLTSTPMVAAQAGNEREPDDNSKVHAVQPTSCV